MKFTETSEKRNLQI